MKCDDELKAAPIIAWGLCIMFMLLGLGGCWMLSGSKVEIKYDNTVAKEKAEK